MLQYVGKELVLILLSIFSSDSTELSKCIIPKLCISRNWGYNRQKKAIENIGKGGLTVSGCI